MERIWIKVLKRFLSCRDSEISDITLKKTSFMIWSNASYFKNSKQNSRFLSTLNKSMKMDSLSCLMILLSDHELKHAILSHRFKKKILNFLMCDVVLYLTPSKEGGFRGYTELLFLRLMIVLVDLLEIRNCLKLGHYNKIILH